MRLPTVLFVLISLTYITTPTQAAWPGCGWTSFARWTGYGFGDGYHQSNCGCQSCNRGAFATGWAVASPGQPVSSPPATELARRWSVIVAPISPGGTVRTASRPATSPRPVRPPMRVVTPSP